MASYNIKMLKDENGIPFVPLVSTEGIQDPEGMSLEERLKTKLGPDNLKPGDNIGIRTEGENCYIDLALPASLNIIDNLTTSESGEGALDAHQGKILDDKITQVSNNIPIIADDLITDDSTKALSANQGYIINNKFNSYLPLTGGTLSGDVLVKRGTTDGPKVQVTNGSASVCVHVGTGGVNHGLYSDTLDKWIVYADSSKIYLNGHATSDLPLTGGTLSDSLTIGKKTNATVTYADKQNPRINFTNSDGSQSVSLIFTDYDSYLAPYGLTLLGNGQSTTNNGAYLKVEGNVHAKEFHGNFVGCPMYIATGAVSAVKNVTAQAFQTHKFDSIDIVNSTYASQSSGVIKVNSAGLYRISFSLRYADVSSANNCCAGISINGDTTDNTSQTVWSTNHSRLTITGFKVRSLKAGDTIQILSWSTVATTFSNALYWVEKLN